MERQEIKSTQMLVFDETGEPGEKPLGARDRFSKDPDPLAVKTCSFNMFQIKENTK